MGSLAGRALPQAVSREANAGIAGAAAQRRTGGASRCGKSRPAERDSVGPARFTPLASFRRALADCSTGSGRSFRTSSGGRPSSSPADIGDARRSGRRRSVRWWLRRSLLHAIFCGCARTRRAWAWEVGRRPRSVPPEVASAGPDPQQYARERRVFSPSTSFFSSLSAASAFLTATSSDSDSDINSRMRSSDVRISFCRYSISCWKALYCSLVLAPSI